MHIIIRGLTFPSGIIAFSYAIIQASISMISFDAETPNFTRRYKWAFRPEYATSFELSPVAQPDIQRYLQECDEILRHVDGLESWGAPHEGGGSNTEVVTNPSELLINFQYPADYVELAKSVSEEMLGENEQGAWAGAWAKGRVEVSVLRNCDVVMIESSRS